jgi:ABC-type lipoprotein release transport system permease subunit
MKLFDSFRSALQSIIVNKLRSALTMLGVIIGVASVIAMVAVGNGASIQVQQQVLNGSGVMPSSKKTLSAQQIRDVAAFDGSNRGAYACFGSPVSCSTLASWRAASSDTG